MTNVDIAVIIGGMGLIGLIWLYFFGNKEKGETAVIKNKVQKATIVVEAAYIPDRLTVKKGTPVEITFDRRDTGECTSRVIFENMPTMEKKSVSADLPEGKLTTVSFTPSKSGKYQFTCGMGMVHGKLIVE